MAAPMIDRRAFLRVSSGALLAGVLGQLPLTARASPAAATDRELIDDVERRTFNFFWETVNRENGLVPDLWPAKSSCNVSTLGFALVAYAIGVERGWITRAEARRVTLRTLAFLHSRPMGTKSRGCGGHRGFHYHYLDMETGLRATDDTEVSCIDAALLHLGFLFAAGWYDQDGVEESTIRFLAIQMVNAAEWDWFQHHGTGGLLPMGWTPEKGFNAWRWSGYSEAKGMHLLALASERHPIRADSWEKWTATFASHWRGAGETRHLACAPLFTHQYSEMWIDFRGLRDPLMREAGFDYFENSRRATYANRDYCIRNPLGWRGYAADVWGLTGSDGPGVEATYRGRRVDFPRYAMRGPQDAPGGIDDGTLAPTAVIGSLPFAPEICMPALREIFRTYGPAIYGQYGFKEAFNPSLAEAESLSRRVPLDPVAGWVCENYFSLDQGPIVGMIANHRNEAVWRVMRKSVHLRRALRRAGFGGGWLDETNGAAGPR